MKRGDFYRRLTGVILILALVGFKAFSQGTQVDFSTIPKSGTILINSHMDDDAIWMLPFWEKTEKFICGAMPATPAFRTIISQQQTFMNNNNYPIDYLGNWYTPWDDITDMEYSRYYLGDDPSYRYLLDDHLETRLYNNHTPLSRVEINKIKAKLEQYFADPSMRRAITHNNWGEYGHEHHKGLNKAVRELAVKYRKDVWMLGCDNGGFIDVDVPDGITYTYGSFDDPDLFIGIRTAYSNNGLWTWYASTVPTGDHKFIKIVDSGSDKSYILKGDEITYPGPAQLEPGAYIFDGNDDYLTLKGNNSPSFTIMMKVRPEMIREMDIASMAEFPGSTKNDRNIYLTNDGHINARIFDGSSKVITSSSVVSAQTWTHIAISGSGSEFRLYINGLLNGTLSTGNAISDYSTPEMILGLATETTTNFMGQINDVRIINRVMTESEIAAASGMVFTISASAGAGGTIEPSGNTSVPILTNRTFTITPSNGYHISDVLVDNISVGQVNNYTFTSVTANHSISASFAQSTPHLVTATAGEGGTILPAGAVTVYEGTTQVFNVNPATGYKISDVLVDGISIGRVSSYVFTNITGDHSISVTFEPTPTYTVNITAGPGGTVSPIGNLVVNESSDHTFSIRPDEGYRITNVLIDGISAGAVTTYTLTNITANHTISATFEIMTYSITASSGSGGSVSPSGILTMNHGTSQTFTFQPETGYRISDVRVDNISVGTPAEYTFNNIISDHTISVSFAIIVNTITSSAQAGGTISPSGNISIDYGKSQTFTISAGEGHYITDVKVDNVSQGALTSFTFNNVTANHSISAEFTPVTFTISASAGTGGNINPAGNIPVSYGTDQTFTFTPGFGYRVGDVRVDNVSIGAVTSYTFNGVSGNHTISVSFATAIYTVEANAGTGGTITPAGMSTVTHGTNLSYAITPATGYRISDVRVDNSSVGPVSAYAFNNVTSNHSITAYFAPITFDITAGSGTGGSISPSGITSVTYGSSQVFTIVPSQGYSISDVMVDNVSRGPVNSYTFSNVTSNHTINASFAANRYTIYASAGQGGTVAPSGTTTVSYGSQVTINITPETGYRISEVMVDNMPSGTLTTYTFANISSNHTLSASFVPITFTINALAGNGGSISTPGITTVNFGSAISYTFIPQTGYMISDVKVDGMSHGPVSSFTFSNITANHTIEVDFAIKTYTITIGSTFGGKVNPENLSEISHGSGVSITFIPDAGYRVADVNIDGVSKGRIESWYFENISEDHHAEVVFELIPTYSIEADAGDGGSITPSGSTLLSEGSEISYIITPDPGYRILDVKVDNMSAGSISEYVFTNISSDHSIKVEFTTKTVVNAYPNPFTDAFKLFIASPEESPFEMIFTDSSGKIVVSQGNVPVNTEIIVNPDIPAGIYYVKIFRSKKLSTFLKMVKCK